MTRFISTGRNNWHTGPARANNALRIHTHGRVLPMEHTRTRRAERLFAAALAATIITSIAFAWQAFG